MEKIQINEKDERFGRQVMQRKAEKTRHVQLAEKEIEGYSLM